MSRCHPLRTTRDQLPTLAETIAVFHVAIDHVSDRLEAAMRVGRETFAVGFHSVTVDLVQEQKGIELRQHARAQTPSQPHARALHRGRRIEHERHTAYVTLGLRRSNWLCGVFRRATSERSSGQEQRTRLEHFTTRTEPTHLVC